MLKSLCKKWWSTELCWTLLFMILLVSPVSCEDFYERLGVTRQATQKDIRKAFKKLALTLHPDKNQDDPNAHDKFLKVSRAYEVLKDEDLRKKYDLYGEDGVKEGGPSGQGYQTWNFYNQNFGIYDDDPEIITLSRSDFQMSVEGTSTVWFINYFSALCGPCHELAPTWREVARELEGVIRIGAVNCADDWWLCQQQGVQSYPSLMMHPRREKYTGERTTGAIVKFALREVKSQVVELWSGNWNNMMKKKSYEKLPWLITFCGDGGDCLESRTTLKLAAMLEDLVAVGSVDCHNNQDVCKKMGVEYGTFYYKAGQVKKGKEMVIASLDGKEVAFQVLEQLPDATKLNQADFKKVLTETSGTQAKPWLVHFVEGETHDLELRKLPAILQNIQIGRVDCRLVRGECNQLHVHKFPTFAIFKAGGYHEFHHGRHTTHDIAAFANEGVNTPVQALGPADFPDRVVNNNDLWFVDFFSPFCPPCLKLLPEFRKMSKNFVGKINFGTIDCTVHNHLCNQYQIQSYPTTIFYNQTTPHYYNGENTAEDMINFIEDTLNPPVIILTPNNFHELLGSKPRDNIWVVDFFAPWCGPCQQLAPQWRLFAKKMKNFPLFRVASVNCQQYSGLCQQHNVHAFPTVRLYPAGSTSTQSFHSFSNWYQGADAIQAWAVGFVPSKCEELSADNFSFKVLESKQPWIIDYYAPWCHPCKVFSPQFEQVCQAMEGLVRTGKVNCDDNFQLCSDAGVRGYPSVKFYKGRAANKGPQSYTDSEPLGTLTADYIVQFLHQKLNKQKKDEL